MEFSGIVSQVVIFSILAETAAGVSALQNVEFNFFECMDVRVKPVSGFVRLKNLKGNDLMSADQVEKLFELTKPCKVRTNYSLQIDQVDLRANAFEPRLSSNGSVVADISLLEPSGFYTAKFNIKAVNF